MKKRIQNGFRLLGLLIAVLIETIPFVCGSFFGVAIRIRPIAAFLSLALAIAITLFSAANPEFFRFGPVKLHLHDCLFIYGIPSVASSAVVNMIYAFIGYLSGVAFRAGYESARSNNELFS
jgi:hypothetical protein